MTTRSRLADRAMMAFAWVLGTGSVVLFVLMDRLRVVTLGWPDSRALAWDAGLSFFFFLQHSGMVRRPFKARLAAVIPQRHQGAVYAIASGVALALVAVLWQHTGTRLLALEGPPLWLARALTLGAFALFVGSALALGPLFDPLGLGPIRAHLRGVPERSSSFVVKGPYRWVRHPLYSCVLLLLWSDPEVTTDRLLLDVLWTGWIVVATILEERDLVADFGDAYRDYQQKVPMLVPWRGRLAF